jgi:hypothetical protein
MSQTLYYHVITDGSCDVESWTAQPAKQTVCRGQPSKSPPSTRGQILYAFQLHQLNKSPVAVTTGYHSPDTTMRNSLLVLVLLAASLLADAWSDVSCGSDGSYTANSTYEANLRRLAADLPAEAAASPGRFAERSIGFWPNRVRATSSCRSAGDGDCAACIAHAFERVKVVCAFHKEAAFYSRDCSIRLDEVRVFGSDLFGELLISNFSLARLVSPQEQKKRNVVFGNLFLEKLLMFHRVLKHMICDLIFNTPLTNFSVITHI